MEQPTGGFDNAIKAASFLFEKMNRGGCILTIPAIIGEGFMKLEEYFKSKGIVASDTFTTVPHAAKR